MDMGFKIAAAAALVSMLPLTANAITIAGNLADPDQSAGSGADGGVYDIHAGPYTAVVGFTGDDPAGEIEFAFKNTSTTALTVAVTLAQILQNRDATPRLVFLGGVDTSWPPGGVHHTAQGVTFDSFKLVAALAAGQTRNLLIDFGDPTGTPGAGPAMHLNVTAIPVPASILMLMGALGGLTYIGRRRAVATA